MISFCKDYWKSEHELKMCTCLMHSSHTSLVDFFRYFSGPDKDLVRNLIISLAFEAFNPVVACGIRYEWPIVNEICRYNRSGYLLRAAVLTFSILVPGVDRPITSKARERVELRIEGEAINRVNFGFFFVFYIFSVTLEAEVIFTPIVVLRCIVVLDATTPLYGTDHVALPITKDWNGGGGKLQWRLSDILGVPAVWLEILSQIPHMDIAFLMRSDKQRVLAAHIVNRHGHVSLSYLLQCSVLLPCPELDTRVPATTYHYRLSRLRLVYADNILHRLVVLSKSCDLLAC